MLIESSRTGPRLTLAKRLFALARRVGIREQLTITGGCAKNMGLMRFVERRVKVKVTALSMDPQLVGALGAAVLAVKK